MVVDIHERFRETGITNSDLSERTPDIRAAVAELSEDNERSIRFIRSISDFELDEDAATLGRFMSFVDFMAAKADGRIFPQALPFLNTSVLRQNVRENRDKAEPRIMGDNDVGLFTFGYKGKAQPAGCLLATPKLAEELCRISPKKREKVKRAFDSLPILRALSSLDRESASFKYGWHDHDRLQHEDFTDHASKNHEAYVRNDRIVWSYDMRVAAVPNDVALRLSSVIHPDDSSFIKRIPVKNLAGEGGKIMHEVAQGQYFARIDDMRLHDPLYTLVPHYAVRYLSFDDEKGYIDGVQSNIHTLNESFDLAAFVQISSDTSTARLRIVETTERAQARDRAESGAKRSFKLRSLPVLEGTFMKTALMRSIDGDPIMLQGHPFRVTNAKRGVSPPPDHGFTFDQAATRFSANISPQGNPSDLSLAFGPDKGLAFFTFSHVKRVNLIIESEEFALEPLELS